MKKYFQPLEIGWIGLFLFTLTGYAQSDALVQAKTGFEAEGGRYRTIARGGKKPDAFAADLRFEAAGGPL